jgi:hypothetical protein
MMNSPSRDVVEELLVKDPTGATEKQKAARAALSLQGANTDLFYNVVPNDPAFCVTLLDNQGAEPLRGLRTNEDQYEIMPIQIRVRASDPDEARGRCAAISEYLRCVDQFVVSGAEKDTWYQCIVLTSAVFLLGQDERQRWLATVNVATMRTEVAKET